MKYKDDKEALVEFLDECIERRVVKMPKRDRDAMLTFMSQWEFPKATSFKQKLPRVAALVYGYAIGSRQSS